MLLGAAFGVQGEADAAALFTRATISPERAFALKGPAPSATLLALDPGALAAFRGAGAGRLDLPLADGTHLTLRLEKFDVLGPHAVVTATSVDGPHAIHPDLTLFKGTVEGESGSWALISLSPEGALGTIERNGERWQISPTGDRPAPGAIPYHVLARERDLPSHAASFHCATDEIAQPLASANALRPVSPETVQSSTTRLICHLAVDCDYEFFANKQGSNLTNATNYIMTLYGVVSLIYERDINVTLQLSYLNIWTTTLDPYSANTTSGELPEFKAYWDSLRTSVPRDIATLISGRALGGGIAYLNTLCVQDFAYTVCAIDGIYNYPTNTSTWDANVVAHEMGHSFSSNHTQSCYWQANGYAPPGARLDSCVAAEGPGCSGPTGIAPHDRGTIMSYCHLLAGGVAANIRLEFHPACKIVMRSAAELSCFGSSAVQPPQNLTASNSPAGLSLNWSASPTPDVIRYDVYRSAFLLDPSPALAGSTTGTTFNEISLGTYSYKVRAARASDQSPFSGEVRLVVCPLSSSSNPAVGTQPVGIASGDFNHDGITDLAVANFGSSDISILIGQGSGGIGNGSFAPAVSYSIGDPGTTLPSSIAVGDFNNDGRLDLAVCENLGGVYILYGQGSGSVGNGTFTAGPVYNLGTSPWAILAADLNEDGITDLAVANGVSAVTILRGQGSGGIGDGTFAAPVNYAAGSTPVALATGDFNADGITDLAVARSGGVSVLLGQGSAGHGDGSFGAPTGFTTGISPFSVATGDFNGDGITDLAVGNAGSGSVSILLGLGSGGIGNGGFASPVNYPAGTNPYSVVVADWNGDGIADLAVANSTSSRIASILLGRGSGGVGDGSFSAFQSFTTSNDSRAALVGDWNGDGMPDLAVVNRTSGTVSPLIASCVASISTALNVTVPSGGETWITGTEHAISWIKGPGVIAVNIDVLLDANGRWKTIATNLTGTSFTWTVNGPYFAGARVRVYDPTARSRTASSPAPFTIFPASLVGVAPGRTEFALQGVSPNPARREMAVTFSLPGDAEATLELLDLAGRRLALRSVGSLGPGPHRVALAEGQPLDPGLYFVRLTQAGRSLALKVAVVR